MKKIVVTGPESTGKSTLVKHLATKLSIPFLEEHARTYLLEFGPDYTFPDLVKIAKKQFELHRESSQQHEVIICDTDLLTIKIWSEVKYQKCDPWITNKYKFDLADLYLLCKPDVDWVSDSLRENPVDREILFELYEEELKSLEANYVVISGPYSERNNEAEKVVKSFIEK